MVKKMFTDLSDGIRTTSMSELVEVFHYPENTTLNINSINNIKNLTTRSTEWKTNTSRI